MPDVSELCVLLTGAGDSVGRVTAEKFFAAGARVHICDIREPAVRATLNANPGMGGTVCDVGDKADVDRLFDDAMAAMGRVDVLVNCVGIAGPRALLEDISDEDWQTTMQINLTGMFYTMKRAIPGMKQRRFGAIQYTEPFLNNLHITEPTLMILPRPRRNMCGAACCDRSNAAVT